MSLFIAIHGREAIPVRALPDFAPDRLYAERIAREFTRLPTHYGRGILRHVQSYKVTEDGKTEAVLPVEWLAILTDVLALSQELDDHLPPRRFDQMGLAIPDPQQDRAYDDAVLSRLPKGVFVWWDEFERAYLKCLRRWPDEQQRDGQLVPHPLISRERHAVIIEGFEQYVAVPQVIAPPLAPVLCASESAPETPRPIVTQEPAESADTTNMVAWRAVILDSWPAIEERHGRKPTARNVLLWIKNYGPRDTIPKEQTDWKALNWVDSYGNPQTTPIKTISNFLWECRKAGKIPA